MSTMVPNFRVRNVLERDSVLVHAVIARLPDERHIAGIGGLESPRKKSRDGITANCRDLASVQ
jgi:hypothetical protein